MYKIIKHAIKAVLLLLGRVFTLDSAPLHLICALQSIFLTHCRKESKCMYFPKCQTILLNKTIPTLKILHFSVGYFNFVYNNKSLSAQYWHDKFNFISYGANILSCRTHMHTHFNSAHSSTLASSLRVRVFGVC